MIWGECLLVRDICRDILILYCEKNMRRIYAREEEEEGRRRMEEMGEMGGQQI